MKQPMLFLTFKAVKYKLHHEFVPTGVSEDAILCCISLNRFPFFLVMHLKCGKSVFGKLGTSIPETVQLLILREVILCRGAKNISPQNSTG